MDWRGAILTITVVSVLSMICVKSGIFSSHNDFARLNRDMSTLEDKMKIEAGNWIHYLETRFNGLSLRQDEYQNSSTLRMDKMEQRIERLERIIDKTYNHENNMYSVKPPKNVAPLINEVKQESQKNN